jgi:tripartite-type tricarboxylate transporter receptor subunit TctC
MFVAHISFLTQNGDQVRSLAMFSSERVDGAEDLPTSGDQGVPMDFPIWGGIVAPKGIPDEARASLESACEEGIHSDAFTERMKTLRQPVAFMGSEEFEAFVRSEFDKNEKLLVGAGLGK